MSSNTQVTPSVSYGSGLYQPGLPIVVRHESGKIELRHTGEHPLEVRKKIGELIHALSHTDGYFTELPVTHQFVSGMYIRRIFIPKDSLIVGKIHKSKCINIVESGDISVLTESGKIRVKAGFTAVSPPGIQKVGYAHEDTVFTNIFRIDEADIQTVEDALTWASYESAMLALAAPNTEEE